MGSCSPVPSLLFVMYVTPDDIGKHYGLHVKLGMHTNKITYGI